MKPCNGIAWAMRYRASPHVCVGVDIDHRSALRQIMPSFPVLPPAVPSHNDHSNPNECPQMTLPKSISLVAYAVVNCTCTPAHHIWCWRQYVFSRLKPIWALLCLSSIYCSILDLEVQPDLCTRPRYFAWSTYCSSCCPRAT